MIGSTEPSKNFVMYEQKKGTGTEGTEGNFSTFLLYKQLHEPNTCGFGRMSAMNTDMSHEYCF